MVSVTCSHVKVRDTGAVGTSFLRMSMAMKKQREDYLERTIGHSFRVSNVNVPLSVKVKDGS